MDLLRRIPPGVKVVMAAGLVLGCALIVIAVQVTPEARPLMPESPSPVSSAPSKENVSKQVGQQISHLKAVVAKNPKDGRSALELARTLQDGHDLVGAQKYYEIALKADPKNLAARIDYSLCLYQSGREREAFVQNAIVLNQDASNAQALYNLGAIYANRGRSDSARYYWQGLIAAHPHDELAKRAEGNLKQLAADGAPPL
jgi:cytochrome c-type biogenesis protein CcmH/NrfG